MKYSKTFKSEIPVLTSQIGTISELIAAIHLIAGGFHVFRALSPNASCDLVAVKNNTVQRVEVKTLHVSLLGNPLHVPKNYDSERFDMLIIVNHQKVIKTLTQNEYREFCKNKLCKVKDCQMKASFRGVCIYHSQKVFDLPKACRAFKKSINGSGM